MLKFLPFHLAGLLLVLFVKVRGKATLDNEKHPMLYFSSKDMKDIRQKSSSSHEKICRFIKNAAIKIRSNPDKYLPSKDPEKFASIWNEHFGNNLCMLSFYCVLYPEDEEAFAILSEYMDRMASYPDWYVASSRGKDQVPIGHSLTGFATAYDFMYPRFDERQRKEYYKAIKRTMEDLNKLFLVGRVEWSKQYIHNHAPSNLVAFLLGSLVVSVHEPNEAKDWLDKVQFHLDFAMEIFSYIIDGSVDEGVSYGSYTSRGLTQYAYLAKRHFNVDHSDNPWLKEHFWFYYHTILPGFQRTVGIGDANYHWFYGPESQLVFLDAFVMNTGHGNWLADNVRTYRSVDKPLAQSTAQIWSTFHTEFLFYNSSIPSRKPIINEKLHIFSDWGVVTYGGGQDIAVGNTFLSFKSGIPNGEAVQEIINSKRYSDLVNGWKNFNAGHEHPDQNSFVFAPNGRYVVSESLYGPKFSYLDNTVVFSPSSTSECNQPWEGQVGECDKWLHYKLYNEHVRGEILAASSSDEMVFIAGEAVGAYSKSLELSSVFRGVMLLNPEVLIVVDTIRLREGSNTAFASCLFHNTWTKFKPHEQLGYKGAKVEYAEGSYSVISLSSGVEKINISLHNDVQPAGLREGPTNYVNVTFPLLERVTNVVHVFSGPNYVVKSVAFQPVSKISGISLSLKVNEKNYDVKISTFVKSNSKMLEPNRERKRITGFGGFAQVRITSGASQTTHNFGLDKATYANEEGITEKEYLLKSYLNANQLRILPKKAFYTTSFESIPNANVETVDKTNWYLRREMMDNVLLRARRVDSYFETQNFIFVFVMMAIMLSLRFGSRKMRSSCGSDRRNLQTIGILAASMMMINSCCIDPEGKNVCFKNSSASQITEIRTESQPNMIQKLTIPTTPFIMLTSLPGSGGDLLEKAFEDSNMTTYLPTRDVNIPITNGKNAEEVDICVWNTNGSERFQTMGWFNSLKTKPILHFNQQKTARLKLMQQRLRENINSPIVMNDNHGFWITKLPWIGQIIGKENFQSVFIVRDPRSWIHALMKNHRNPERSNYQLKSLVNHFENVAQSCSTQGSQPPIYLNPFKSRQTSEYEEPDEIEKLSMIWTMTVGTALKNAALQDEGSWPLHVIRFEDILNNPENSTRDMFSKLGLPLGVRLLNKIMRTVISGHFTIPYDGTVSPKLLSAWKDGLPRTDVRKIENICCDMMGILGYECE